jgi:hypothetical protein
MPFTFSHPAIILPLSKSKKMPLSFTGLIAGSMAPDFEFLLRLRNTANFGHTWWGILVCDVPFAIALSFVFHIVVRDTLILHLPKYFRQRFYLLMDFNWWQYLKGNKFNFLLAVLIGILSHFFLDSFTHQNKTIEQWVPLFSAVIIIFKQQVPVYVILQILTSLIGGLYILWFIAAMEKGEGLQEKKNISGYWVMLGVFAMVIFVLRLLLDKVHQSIADIIIAAVGSFVYAFLLVTALYFKGSSRIKNPLKYNQGI